MCTTTTSYNTQTQFSKKKGPKTKYKILWGVEDKHIKWRGCKNDFVVKWWSFSMPKKVDCHSTWSIFKSDAILQTCTKIVITIALFCVFNIL